MTDIIAEENIWFPGPDAIYQGRQSDYGRIASHILEEQLIELVQKRAQEDGEYAIVENGLIGDKEDLMRQMIGWVSEPRNITQCADAHLVYGVTVDWVCRNLANIAKKIAEGIQAKHG